MTTSLQTSAQTREFIFRLLFGRNSRRSHYKRNRSNSKVSVVSQTIIHIITSQSHFRPRTNQITENRGKNFRRELDAQSSSRDFMKASITLQAESSESLKQEVWVKRDNARMTSSTARVFERTQSLGTEQLHFGYSSSLLSSSNEAIYDEPPSECRPRTNTMPQTSPRVMARAAQNRSTIGHTPTPIPRRQLSGNGLRLCPTQDSAEPIYDLPMDSIPGTSASIEPKSLNFQKLQQNGGQQKNERKSKAVYAQIIK